MAVPTLMWKGRCKCSHRGRHEEWLKDAHDQICFVPTELS